MDDRIDAIGSAESVGVKNVSLDAVASVEDYSVQATERADRAMETALQFAVTNPAQNGRSRTAQEGIVSGAGGAIDTAKNDMIAKPSADHASADMEPVNKTAQMARNLYVQLGRWQAIWAVANRVQRNSDHIMRGQ